MFFNVSLFSEKNIYLFDNEAVIGRQIMEIPATDIISFKMISFFCLILSYVIF